MPAARWPGSVHKYSKVPLLVARKTIAVEEPTRKLIGLYTKLWHGNVMNGTIAVDHVNLHYSVFRHPQIGVNLAFNLTGVADIHQFAVGNIGTQCKGNVRTVGDRVQRSVAVGSKSGRDKY